MITKAVSAGLHWRGETSGCGGIEKKENVRKWRQPVSGNSSEKCGPEEDWNNILEKDWRETKAPEKFAGF